MSEFNTRLPKVKIKLYELAVLLYNMNQAANDSDVGFADANKTVEMISRELNKTLDLPATSIESLAWAANMMMEKKKFTHPDNIGFNQFIKKIEDRNKLSFNKTYNFFEKKETK